MTHKSQVAKSNIRNNQYQNGTQVVFPETDKLRKQVQNVKVFPSYSIGQITAWWDERHVGFGTGFLVEMSEEPFILTVAHNFYDRSTNKKALKANFSLGLNNLSGSMSLLGNFTITNWRFPEEFSNGTTNNYFLYDYALAKINKQDESLIPMPLEFDAQISDRKIVLEGYPGDKSRTCDELWRAPGELKNGSFEDPLLFHNASTFDGNSGSPILGSTKSSQMLSVIGIHSRYFVIDKSLNVNAGRRLDWEVQSNLLKWAEDLSG
ncbi:trypsin-like serine peptidase [Candidatus Leptofilum sp.]|uniref:trypsin-like serine peptidase n=1 Tax=Candidatus Leptofilum sp. TaxID=3241576 RepID=UPI003B590290